MTAQAITRRAVIESGLCIGCGGCVGAEPAAAMRWNDHGFLRPDGPAAWLDRADPGFAATCPFSPVASDETRIAQNNYPAAPHNDDRLGRFEAAFVGHVEEAGFRTDGSSGGLVTWVAAALLRSGSVDAVAHVAPKDPQSDGAFFGYQVSRSEADLRASAKSRYYPIELAGVLSTIRATPGRYAVVGLPCFIKAINLQRAADPIIAERVVATLGLFCGHLKSARFVDSFAWQLGVPTPSIAAVDYRRKDPGRPANLYTADLTLRDGSHAVRDWWNLADGDWGAGFFQNPACNMCDDVLAETADIAFGDAWVEPYASDGRGTNVAIVRSPEILALIHEGVAADQLQLKSVDADYIADTQAAGLRQRREGLAYRLTWYRPGLRLKKRVKPSRAQPTRRKLIYRARAAISWSSHRVAALALRRGAPQLYIRWARLMLGLYHGVAYSRGRVGRLVDRLLGPTKPGPA